MTKKIIRDGKEYFYCPDCDDYCPKEEMSRKKNRKNNIGTYCIKHKNLRNINYKKRHMKRKNERYKLEHRVNNDHKYYFKGPKRIKSVSIRPRTTGICENWSKKPYERRNWINENF